MNATFMYRNHRGQIEERHVKDASIIYDYAIHPEFGYMQPGWYLHGLDVERNAYRSFALHNIVIPEHTQDHPVYQLQIICPRRTIAASAD